MSYESGRTRDAYESDDDLEEPFEPEVNPPNPSLTSSERTWGLCAHLSTLSGYVGLPFGWIVGPLIVYLVKKDESPFVRDHAREALNMGISCTIYLIVSVVLAFFIIGIVTALIVTIGAIVYAIVAGMKANEGRSYRYPFIIRFIK
ncbi:MAG: DUF4870 domain-containing protein [Planctomycetota bacterium]|nr:DUF4870 domain-containing protein [Planctomycetota bacterium]